MLYMLHWIQCNQKHVFRLNYKSLNSIDRKANYLSNLQALFDDGVRIQARKYQVQDDDSLVLTDVST